MRAILVRGLKIAGKSLVALLIFAIAGWFAIPSLRVYQFESALANQDYEGAMTLVDGPFGIVKRDDVREIEYEVSPLTWKDFFCGMRFIDVRTTYVVDGKEYVDTQDFWATAIFLDKDGCQESI